MNEMIGYDPDLKWGPALRIEQRLDLRLFFLAQAISN